jgi:hypothetical protein
VQQRVFIVYPIPDMILVIEDLIAELKNEGLELRRVGWAKTRSAAERQIRTKPADLIVTALEIAADDKSPVAAGEQRGLGLELVRSLRNKPPPGTPFGIRAVIVTGNLDYEATNFAQSEAVELAAEGDKFGENLKSAIRNAFGLPRSLRVNPSISLSTDKTNCTYIFQVEGSDLAPPKPLQIETDRLEELVEEFRYIDVRNPAWQGSLTRLGQALADQLFQAVYSNDVFRDEFTRWETKVGIQNIRVRFTVPEKLYPIAFEAPKQRAVDDCWMLRTAVYRGEPSGIGRTWRSHSLFEDEQMMAGPVNFLLVQADVPENASVKTNELRIDLD